MKRRNGAWRAFAGICLSMICLCSSFCVQASETDTELPAPDRAETRKAPAYAAYAEEYAGTPFGAPLTLTAEQAQGGNAALTTYADREKVTVLHEKEAVTWSIDLQEDANYLLAVDYCPLPGRGLDCSFAVEINGQTPFSEAENISITRVFADAEKPILDLMGNQIRPEQKELFVWRRAAASDTVGYTDAPYIFFLPKGKSTLTLRMVNEAMAVSGVTLLPMEELPPYAPIGAEEKQKTASAFFLREAEETEEKSHSMIYATSNFGDPSVSPSDPTKIRLNTLGQMNWRYAGQWVTWKVQVPEAGYYRLNFKYRQNFRRGMPTARRLRINGKVPFREADCLNFPFNDSFENYVPGDGKDDYWFFLQAGDNDITLEVVIGEVGPLLRQADDIVAALNDMYRQIIMITGTVPDLMRDYYLDRELPELLPTFKRCAKSLYACSEELKKDGRESPEIALFEKVARQLESFIEKPHTIQKRLDSYKNNVASLASTVLGFKEQPLELDQLCVFGADRQPPEAKAGFFARLVFRAKAFFGSFTEDYSAVGMVSGEERKAPITVWANSDATGRDQLFVINRMIGNDFTKNTGIPVSLKLVQGGQVLTQAILAGSGPDVAIIIPEATPINLSMRGALKDLSSFPEFEEMKSWFYPSAFIPYEYEGGIYGMPETQVYSMQFYRTDIFDQMGLCPPETWEDFYVVSGALQKSKLDVGIPENVQFFETLMLQMDAPYYNPSHTKTGFDSPEALKAFRQWTSFYQEYSFPLNFDAYNRFRTGEMPLVIMPTAFYNQLTVAAPEIKGKWKMVPLPGYEKDGRIDRSQSAIGTCSIMLSDTEEEESSFAFIKWWSGAKAQSTFGCEVEAQMGPAARYSTANLEAFENLPWTMEEKQILKEQWVQVDDVPIVPGDYYVGRNLANAFRRVVYYHETPREVLNRYNTIINKEIIRKRKEYHLSLS